MRDTSLHETGPAEAVERASTAPPANGREASGEEPKDAGVGGAGVPTPILWHSNAPWVDTGYGQQSALFGPRVQKRLGYRVAFSAFHGLRGSRIGWVSADKQPMMVYPGGRDGYGSDVLGAHARHWFGSQGGLVVTLTDPWVLNPLIVSRLPVLSWIPVDHDPLIGRTNAWLHKSQAIPVAMSHFGESVLRAAGHEALYVPHGVDTSVFKPMDKEEARRALGIPQSAFVVGMVAANVSVPSRKNFEGAFRAVVELQNRYPDVLLYLHTRLQTQRGENLPMMVQALKLRVQAADQYSLVLGTPPAVVAATMNAFDVLLNPSFGEGFGIPLLEAQACGIPCITTDFSSMPEVAPPEAGNWVVGGERFITPFESEQLRPNTDELVECLVDAHDRNDKRVEATRERVWRHAQTYAADQVTDEFWKPALERAEGALAWRRQLLAQL